MRKVRKEWPPSNQGQCDPAIYSEGKTVAILPCMPAMACEIWIKAVREGNPDLKIDWHYVGGRNVILALGNIETAKKACLSKADYMFSLWDDYTLENIKSWFQ